MKSPTLCRLAATVSAVVLSLSVHAAEPAIIAKARAYLGKESALNGVDSLRYVGTMIAADPADPSKETRSALEISFQNPYQQLIVVTSEKLVDVTGLDGYEAWRRTHEVANPAKWKQANLDKNQIKRIRAETWENLALLRGDARSEVRVEDQGPASADGIACQKIAFIHDENIVFFRFFEVATGRLVLTETEAGTQIREQGEIVVNGIKFPKSMTTTAKNAAGQAQKITVNFEQIVVNETMPNAIFKTPMLVTK